MRPVAVAGTRGAAFWLIVLASTAGTVVNAANNPTVTRLVQERLGGDSSLAGVMVALSAFASVAAMPLAGALVDRHGPRVVLQGATALSVLGLAVVLVSLTLPGLAIDRIVFGGGNAAVATALTAWIVAETPAAERGRALSYFGLSVWVGLALGPLLGESLFQLQGFGAVAVASIVLQLACLLCVARLPGGRRPAPDPTSPHPRGAAGALRTVRDVARPGLVALSAWAAEGFMAAFLIQHLTRGGLPSTGVLGASSVFTVFAAAVIVTRLAVGGLPDRIGARRTAHWSLVVLGAGLAVLAFSDTFALASLGVLLMGAGYSPLYPALTMLATEGLDPARRSTGVGVFSAFTSVGYALGALVGGILIDVSGEATAFLVIAAVQFAALVLLRRPR